MGFGNASRHLETEYGLLQGKDCNECCSSKSLGEKKITHGPSKAFLSLKIDILIIIFNQVGSSQCSGISEELV